MLTSCCVEEAPAAAAAAAGGGGGGGGGGPQLLALAGDALRMAVAAHALSPAPAPAPSAAPTPLRDDLPEVSLAQVAWHDHVGDCWLVVYDLVYDVTPFLWQHPGGEGILLEYAGRDATLAFAGIGHGPAMLAALRPRAVGRLPPCERIYSCAAAQGGVLQLLRAP